MKTMKRISSQYDFKRLMNPRAKKGEAYVPTDVEHMANIITHGGCIVPSILAMLWMLYMAQTGLQFFIAVLYGWALVALFSVSCTFHTLAFTGRFHKLRHFFHVADRAVIYIFIASSYSPWLTLRDFGGIEDEMMWLIWIMAVCGIIYSYTFHEKYKILEIVLYLIIGVCPAAVAFLMREPSGIYELFLGGVTFVLGVVFFKSDGVIPFAHAIWHLFVLVGTMFHYYAINLYLIGQEVDEININK
ncbi:monocyte to macrophage differentiation factor-like [Saccostrea cucullata]|uniref:monocyte to macrophage differentiation factor-like n=1 Tax=Saccostrea cuccullata TaxID=36930 RepID=UPI002ED1DE0C